MISFAKKFLSIALAAVLLLGVMPAAVFAEEVSETNAETAETETAAAETAEEAETEAAEAAEEHVHEFVKDEDASQDPTCTEAGVLVEVCSCGETKTTPLNPLGHDYEEVRVEPSCTEKGSVKYVCSHCKEEDPERPEKVLPMLDHKYGEYVVTKEATATEAGEEVATCEVCGLKKAREIPAKGIEYAVEVYGVEGRYIATVTVKEGHVLADSDLAAYIPDAPEGTEFDSWRLANNANAIGTAVNSNISVYANFREIPNYNPRPDGPTYLYNITLDENWDYGAKSTYEVKDNQRLGTLFYKGLMPVPSRDLHVFRGWYLCDEEGNMTDNKWNEETIFTIGRNCTLKAKWAKEARVNLMIYRNGRTDVPYDVVPLYGYAVGDVIHTKDLDIKDYYKNGGKPFDFDGWFNRGGWTLYKAKDNPKPVSAIETVDLNGDTTLFCMITDSNAPASNKNPDRTNPKTGDESMIIATTAVMLVSAGALAVFFMDRKRRNG